MTETESIRGDYITLEVSKGLDLDGDLWLSFRRGAGGHLNEHQVRELRDHLSNVLAKAAPPVALPDDEVEIEVLATPEVNVAILREAVDMVVGLVDQMDEVPSLAEVIDNVIRLSEYVRNARA